MGTSRFETIEINGPRVAEFRQEKRWSQQRLADKASLYAGQEGLVKRSRISMLEPYNRVIVGERIANAIAGALGVEVQNLESEWHALSIRPEVLKASRPGTASGEERLELLRYLLRSSEQTNAILRELLRIERSRR